MAKTFKGLIFDKDFVLKKHLTSLGFRKTHIDDSYLRLQDWVHADLVDVFEGDAKTARQQVKDWKHKLKDLLSKPVGKYAHKKRPHRSLLPKMNSGDLRDSVKVTFTAKRSTLWSYELNVRLTSKHKAKKASNMDHADLTNANVTRAGTNKRNVAWRGWADEMMDGKGLKGVPSARNLMRSLFR